MSKVTLPSGPTSLKNDSTIVRGRYLVGELPAENRVHLGRERLAGGWRRAMAVRQEQPDLLAGMLLKRGQETLGCWPGSSG